MRTLSTRRFRPELEQLESRVVLDAMSAGVRGVNARFLTTPIGTLIDGRHVSVGQIEPGRPNDPTVDTRSHADVRPWAADQMTAFGVRLGDGVGVAPHALAVASAIISSGRSNAARDEPGIAPLARLRATATGFDVRQSLMVLAAQRIATQTANQDGQSYVTINQSYNLQLRNDGRSQASLGMDWLAISRNMLGVYSAGNRDPLDPDDDTWGAPADSFNGLTVAATDVRGAFGFFNFIPQPEVPVYRTYSDVNAAIRRRRDSLNDRTLVDLVAPGENIRLARIRPDGTSEYYSDRGTSYAAPLVAGAATLLEQYGRSREAQNAAGWNSTQFGSPLALRAVLMNSADKLADTGDGRLIGMEKTILDSNRDNWAQNGLRDEAHPLDPELGTGQLNVRRALNQFSSGAVTLRNAGGVAQTLPTVGWSMDEINPQATTRTYSTQALKGDTFVSITLAWNRLVNLSDTDADNAYSARESFAQAQFQPNLNLELLRSDGTPVAASRSVRDNVEHFFFDLPADDTYQIRVTNPGGLGALASVPYALAWWGCLASVGTGRTFQTG